MTSTPLRRRTRDRLIAAGLAVVVVAVGLVVYLTSDIRAATLHVAATTATPSEPTTPTKLPTALGPVWTAATDPALGAVVSSATGVVITTDAHGLTGRDAATGEMRWSYTRSNRTMCRAAATIARTNVPSALVDGVAAVYSVDGFCSQVETFAAANGERARDRTSPLAPGGYFVHTGTASGAVYSGWVSPTLVEVWGDSLIRTSQYGDLPNPTQPDNLHLGCVFSDLAIASQQFGTIEHCQDKGSHARIVLNVVDPGCSGCGYPSGWDTFRHKPRMDVDTGSDDAMIVGITPDRVAVLVSAPQPAVVVYDAAGQQVGKSSVAIPAAEITAAARLGPAPAVVNGNQRISLVGTHLLAVSEDTVQGPAPATSLTTPTLPTAATTTSSSNDLGLPLTSSSSNSEVSLESLTVNWALGSALGLPAMRNGRLLEPVQDGLAPFDPITGRAAGAVLPLDRGSFRGRVDAAAVGDTIVEWRQNMVVALR